jgi:hypothetical protein
MTTETPEPRFKRFRLIYPSGTVVDAYYGDGAMVEEVRATRPMATVEAIEEEPTR